METRMNAGVYTAKEKLIDDLENQFVERVKMFTSDAKTRMRSVSREAAMQVFEFTLVFLTQVFPDLSKLESASDVTQDETMNLREDFEKLERTLSEKLKDAQQSLCKKLEDAQQSFSEKLEDAQHSLSEKVDAQQTFCEKLNYAQQSFSEKLEDAQRAISEKLSEAEEKASSFEKKVENDLEKLNKSKESHTHQILGLRKLQKLLCDKTKISQTVAATTFSLASVSTASRLRLSHKSTFSGKSPIDTYPPAILDMKLLPGGLAILSDFSNNCLKLFNLQGRHIYNQALDSIPFSMTVMDITCKSSWDLWVTLPNKNTITLLGVTPNGINIKTSMKTSKQYLAIAAVTTQTLAVGLWSGAGIDLIDLSGRILRQLSSTLNPFSMVTTADGYLIMSIVRDNSIAKLKLEDNSTVFRHKVQQIENPRGVGFVMDGSSIIADRDKRTLNLISPDGVWVKNLWTHPGGEDKDDSLLSVSVMEQRCVCSTFSGSVFVMDVSY